jgi:UDP-N-acetylmuramate dehydrogenase
MGFRRAPNPQPYTFFSFLCNMKDCRAKMSLVFLQNQPLREFSTFGIGGNASYFTSVRSVEEMKDALLWAKEKALPFFILGKGSNCLFDDKGYRGLVILNKIDFFQIENQTATVGAGFSFSLLGTKLSRMGLTGLEFASGIPASVGGAVWMNAGANGKETSEALVEVSFVDENGVERVFRKEELEFRYRFSSFQNMKGAIVSAQFHLQIDQETRQRQLTIIDYRKKTQPLDKKSAGCVFRNPQTGSAGALIDSCGLKGMNVGGAFVSDKHANFIINSEGARAQDVLHLISEVQRKVHEQTGISLEMEIRYIPFEE